MPLLFENKNVDQQVSRAEQSKQRGQCYIGTATNALGFVRWNPNQQVSRKQQAMQHETLCVHVASWAAFMPSV